MPRTAAVKTPAIKSAAKPRSKKVNPKTGMFFTPKTHEETPVETPADEPHITVVELVDPQVARDAVLRIVVSTLQPLTCPEWEARWRRRHFDTVQRLIEKRQRELQEAQFRWALATVNFELLYTSDQPFNATSAEIVIEHFEANRALDQANKAATRAFDFLEDLKYRLNNYDDEFVLHPTIPSIYRPRRFPSHA